ncbi:NB-ARC domain-containing protein [Pseudofrankia inefficax]|uniref:NB-ARC domain protein n=1 Tax=Pseudofrankia inefficax (strain DSM 45817 / CECT 9037 / DDB 130130 / EuI1c) TaxID=298654 RepID=E3J9H0_PSEI1|nr:NB-ARC domain-containing protein [Pseudofrankia inefficax]ADP83334.1 NB-ARC domain protein [Pseudofrankia inefficax]
MDRLSEEEVRELADLYPDPVSARHLLVAAGWRPGRMPVWMIDADTFWREVAEKLEGGLVADGRRRLLAAAAERWPANPVFATAATGGASRRRLIPAPAWVPTLPAFFVERTVDTAAVRTRLVAGSASQVVGVVGMGGVGKSTLAMAIAHDPAVREAFPDGILWLGVGQRPDPISLLGEVLTAFGDRAQVLDPADGSRRLREVLVDARALLVLDDVWDIGVLDALQVPAGTRILVTTRSRDTLYGDADVYELATADPMTSRRILASYARCEVEDLPPAADLVLKRCDGLVLALALTGAMVGTGRRWETVAERLRRADLDAIKARFPHYPHPSLLVALDASVGALPEAQAQRFRELAAFEGRGPVPAEVVLGFWNLTGGLDGLDAEDLLDLFSRRSLLRLDRATSTVTLHDLLFDFARGALTRDQLAGLHGRLAAWLLDRWGGLADDLPRLRDGGARDDLDRYGLTSLVEHLLAADSLVIVDRLLSLGGEGPDGRAVNIWHAAHENQGTANVYLASIRAASKYTEGQAPADDATMFVRLVTYSLLIGSIASLAENIPAELIALLVENRIWLPAHALAYAQATPDPHLRVEALIGLTPYLPVTDREVIFRQALAVATALRGPYERIEALIDLAPQLPASERDPILRDVAAALADEPLMPYFKALKLAELATYLPAAERDQILNRALDITTTIDHEVWGLDDRIAPTIFASEHVLDFWDDENGMTLHDQTYVLIRMAPHLTGALSGRAVSIAARLDPPSVRARALIGLAPYLPASDADAVLRRGLAIAATVKDPYDRAGLFIGGAVASPATERDQLLVRALAGAVAIAEPALLARTLAQVAACWPPHSAPDRITAQAVTAAASLRSPHRRARAMTYIATCLPAAADAVLDQALSAANAIDVPRRRAWALTGLAPHVPAPERDSVLRQALSAARTIGDGYLWADQWTGQPAGEVDALIRDALPDVTVDQPYVWARSLANLAAQMPARDRAPVLRQALAAAYAVDLLRLRAEALAGLLPHLPAVERDEVLRQTLTTASLDGRSTIMRVVLIMLRDKVVAAEAVGASVISALRRSQAWWP